MFPPLWCCDQKTAHAPGGPGEGAGGPRGSHHLTLPGEGAEPRGTHPTGLPKPQVAGRGSGLSEVTGAADPIEHIGPGGPIQVLDPRLPPMLLLGDLLGKTAGLPSPQNSQGTKQDGSGLGFLDQTPGTPLGTTHSHHELRTEKGFT